jgi:hypothetical protein
MAADGWMQMIHTDSEEERAALNTQLKEYCGLDTFAMIKILDEMHTYFDQPETGRLQLKAELSLNFCVGESMSHKQFLFGQPVLPSKPKADGARPLFILGAYPSALHVRWYMPGGQRPIQAVAIDPPLATPNNPQLT